MPKQALAEAVTGRTATLFIALAALLLAGCSTTRVIDSDVTAFQTWQVAPPGPGTPYRFERLPSQQTAGSLQDQIEAAARPALAKVGLVPSEAAARYSVQVLLRAQAVERVVSDPFGYGGFGPFGGYRGYGGYGYRGFGAFGFGGSRGASLGLAFPLGVYESTTYRHELTLLMRDQKTQQVAFESRALHDGPWNDSLNLLPAMLDAALRGFPQPPQGTRRIPVELVPAVK